MIAECLVYGIFIAIFLYQIFWYLRGTIIEKREGKRLAALDHIYGVLPLLLLVLVFLVLGIGGFLRE